MAHGERPQGPEPVAPVKTDADVLEVKRQMYFSGLKEGRIVYFRDNLGRDRPAIVTNVFLDAPAHEGGRPTGVINCVAFMDDTMCVSFRSSVKCGIDSPDAKGDHDKGHNVWHWMFEGQNTRYQPDRTEQAGQLMQNAKIGWSEKREKS